LVIGQNKNNVGGSLFLRGFTPYQE